jgi:hypothetical protein
MGLAQALKILGNLTYPSEARSARLVAGWRDRGAGSAARRVWRRFIGSERRPVTAEDWKAIESRCDTVSRFTRDSRQQRRAAALVQMFAEVSREFSSLPRQNRRKIARAKLRRMD